MKVEIVPATDGKHKWVAVFDNTKQVPFGAHGMSDYTIHKNRLRRARYLQRHEANEDWDNPVTAGALSRWILWNKPSLQESIQDFKRKFNLE
jgi:hypothetical protein